MYTGVILCPRCRRKQWHRSELAPTSTGVEQTELICIRCREKLVVRSYKGVTDQYVIAERWTWVQLGKLKPRWQVWRGEASINPPVYKGESKNAVVDQADLGPRQDSRRGGFPNPGGG